MGHQQQAYGYSRDFTTTSVAGGSGAHYMQSFDTGSAHQLFGLQAGMEMLAMVPLSKDFLSKVEEGSSSHVMMMPASDVTTMPDHSWQQQLLIVDNESSLRCLFPCQDDSDDNNYNEGQLSLSLISNPHQTSHENHDHHQQFGLLKPPSLSYNSNTFHQYYPASYEVRNSMYLMPAQELLNEFCNFGRDGSSPIRRQKSRKLEEDDSSSLSPTLLPMDPLSLQRRKAKLLSMLEEVDRRYKRYCEQMQGVVSSFEAVAGEGSAAVYSALASKAMSRHFRCLRDGIVAQIRATKKVMGEKDPVGQGTTKGETPRLKVLDQCIRQQKAFQQGVESHPLKPQRELPERSVSILRAWLFEHFLHPYPSDVDKHILARQTGLSRSQVSNWFINVRVRLWKPMVEEMYTEETKEKDDDNNDNDLEDDSNNNSCQPDPNQNPNPSATTTSHLQDPKPQLHIEPDSLSSIVSKRMTESSFGMVELDFASYSNNNNNQLGNFGNRVSLTLGLQQHSGEGMSLSFSPASQQSLFFSREQMEEEQNLPYRNLMGAQLLHDLAHG